MKCIVKNNPFDYLIKRFDKEFNMAEFFVYYVDCGMHHATIFDDIKDSFETFSK